jgi:DNA relaxase NicK
MCSSSVLDKLGVDVLEQGLPDVEIIGRVQRVLNSIFGTGILNCGDKLAGGRNFFNKSLQLQNNAGFVTFGGNDNPYDSVSERCLRVPSRLQIHLTGQGCAQIPAWSEAYIQLKNLDIRITRVDLAYDDHEGSTSIDLMRDLYEKGCFTARGRRPAVWLYDDLGYDTGKTLYVGKSKHGKQYRGYEKGKQLGNPNSKWVRHEVEIRCKGRDIPLETLIKPAEFLAGTYPALTFIAEAAQKIATKQLTRQFQFEKSANALRHQYGSVIHYARAVLGMTAEEIYSLFTKPEVFPKWFAEAHLFKANRIKRFGAEMQVSNIYSRNMESLSYESSQSCPEPKQLGFGAASAPFPSMRSTLPKNNYNCALGH